MTAAARQARQGVTAVAPTPALRRSASRPQADSPARAEPRLARIAALVADASRARMLCHLLGGEYASAGELAAAAGVGPPTASAHLAKLLAAGLVAAEARGRHRYFRLADGDVAHALEAMALVAERGTHERVWSSPARARLRQARCCYGHLAGRLGVGMLRSMRADGWLSSEDERCFRVTARGEQGLVALGLDGAAWRRRSAAGNDVAYACLDWSERRDHLAGKLAVAVLQRCLEAGWLRRDADRAVSVTPTGVAPLDDWLRASRVAQRRGSEVEEDRAETVEDTAFDATR